MKTGDRLYIPEMGWGLMLGIYKYNNFPYHIFFDSGVCLVLSIDDMIDAWHNDTQQENDHCELWDWLGWTEDEYWDWVTTGLKLP